MSFYHLGYEGTLDLPLKTFWMMSNNINRIQSEQDIRALAVFSAGQSAEGFKRANDTLKREMGDVVKERQEVIAAAGLARLRQLAAG